MLRNILLTVLFLNNASIFGMEKAGMQELAKHKAEFQAGIKKLQEFIPERNLEQVYGPDCGYTPTSAAQLAAGEREMRNRAHTIAKELEDAFNSVTCVLPPQRVVQKMQKPAALKRLWELTNRNSAAAWAATDHADIDKAFFIEEWRQQAIAAQELEEAIDERDALIARLQAQGSPQQAMAAQEHQALAYVRAQLQEKDKALEQATIELAKENEYYAQLTVAYQLTQEENTHLKTAQDKNGLAYARIISLLALFEASQTTGWEVAFVQAIKEELK